MKGIAAPSSRLRNVRHDLAVQLGNYDGAALALPPLPSLRGRFFRPPRVQASHQRVSALAGFDLTIFGFVL